MSGGRLGLSWLSRQLKTIRGLFLGPEGPESSRRKDIRAALEKFRSSARSLIPDVAADEEDGAVEFFSRQR